MKTHTAHRPRKGSQDALYESQLEIGLTPTVWRAVRAAAVKAQESGLSRFSFVPHFLPRIDAALSKVRKGNYELGEPNVILSGMVASWIALADAVSKFGDQASQEGGLVISCGTSAVLHSRKPEDD